MDVSLQFKPTPAQLAEAFWNMGSDEQADFYAALNRIAGYMLCMQTAWIVDEIAARAMKDDRDALEAFQTMHAHSDGYMEIVIDRMTQGARMVIDRMAKEAKCSS